MTTEINKDTSNVASTSSTKQVPPGFTVHREASAEVLLADGRDVFINPIQEFNRDLSSLVIRTWSEVVNEERRAVWERKRQAGIAKKGKKRKHDENGEQEQPETVETIRMQQEKASSPAPSFRDHTFTLFEGLSATGLRSIRYAKEIPLLKWVLANDLLPQAAANIQQNVDWNDLGVGSTSSPEASTSQKTLDEAQPATGTKKGESLALPKVRVSQGDCCSALYAHRLPPQRFDVIDLDPYGTAAPFIDGAVQAVADGGLLCVTCTDLAVLAGNNYPEKCYTNYGGSPIKGEYTHEGALRLLLHTLASSAARYGRYIEPVLSLSIDYYIRVFIRVRTGPSEAKKVPSQTSLIYVCQQCQAHHAQAMGKLSVKENGKHVNLRFGLASGPPCSDRCEHCNARSQVAGPMWTGPLHNSDFIAKVLSNLPKVTLGTADRIRGMLTLAQHELPSLFYFTPARVASAFHANSPSLLKVASALVNAGYAVSRSHACPGSVKTDAPTQVVLDIMRKWIEDNPVKMENIKENSPARVLLAQASKTEIDFTHNNKADAAMLVNVKVVRYQQNPTANWGPQAKAGRANGKKAKLDTSMSTSDLKNSSDQAYITKE
ncbi:N2,N2-dimethylguanosine tRNA methyltransferase [Cystobasidium minutum MCA 4210]|uniref:N2,N2-dimethylguanosine tRNA methyltransferase n=1 Tax=Cystobasidium minutum MCA 4210 TaxID=1397322 RepID=UPI0034CFB1A7|eukprot:jgi/Rhomi1/147564/e_gw1.8.123.1